jgi:POT family proton-dependent oligopeptide transporter
VGADIRERDTSFLGHPRGLAWLSFTEVWERFSYYGMQALLVLYMTHRLLLPGHVEHVLGFATFRRALETVYGPLSSQALSSVVFGLFTGLVWLAPIAGGVVADRLTGKTAAITVGAVLMCVGHLTMALEPAFLVAITCLLVGVGLFKGNLASQVGSLYAADDPRAASAFQIYNFGIQIAVLVAPLVCGTLGELLGWHWGFGAAGMGMIVALVIYRLGRKWLPPDAPVSARTAIMHPRLTRLEWRRLAVMLGLLPVLALAMNVSTQVGNGYVIWAEQSFRLQIGGLRLPVTWLQSLDGVSTMIAIAASLAFWRWWEARRGPVHEATKLLVGAGFFTLAPLVLVAASTQLVATGQRASLGYALLFELVLNLGWANIFPISMSLFSRSSPRGIVSTVMGMVYLQVFIASLITGWAGTMLERLSGAAFWLLHSALAGGALLILLTAQAPLKRLFSPSGGKAALA